PPSAPKRAGIEAAITTRGMVLDRPRAPGARSDRRARIPRLFVLMTTRIGAPWVKGCSRGRPLIRKTLPPSRVDGADAITPRKAGPALPLRRSGKTPGDAGPAS